MEFKGPTIFSIPIAIPWINRIRLEFKVISTNSLSMPCLGLIESDWNLKQAEYHDMTPRQMLGINRIRLEFKVFPKLVEDCWVPWINRIRLEFKG